MWLMGWRRVARAWCHRRGPMAHVLRVIAMVGHHRAFDFVLLLSVRVTADVDPGDELNPVKIGKAVDAPR